MDDFCILSLYFIDFLFLFFLKKYDKISTMKQPVQGVKPLTFLRGEVVQMSVFESLSLMIAFGMLLLALLAYIERNDLRRK